jgi:hypothetical protein
LIIRHREQTFSCQALGSRKVEADFSGGYLSSDGGSLLLREINRKHSFTAQLAECFTDTRFAPLVEHKLPHLLAQRIHAIALEYEDVNDHDKLRLDPLLALTCDKEELLGEERAEENQGKGLAGKSTINRLELGANGLDSTKKIKAHPDLLRDFLIEQGVKRIPRKSRVITIDFDATEDPIHGCQDGRFFHGYDGHYCYQSLYAFSGDIPLWAQLRQSDRDASDGTLEALKLSVAQIRKRHGKKAAIIIRADSGFCRDTFSPGSNGSPTSTTSSALLEILFSKNSSDIKVLAICTRPTTMKPASAQGNKEAGELPGERVWEERLALPIGKARLDSEKDGLCLLRCFELEEPGGPAA